MNSQLIKQIKDQKGFTLVEMLIVIAVIFLIVGMISATYIQSINTNRDVITITKSEIDSRVAIYGISKEIREALDMLIAEGDGIKFSSNIDSDIEFETVYYYLSGTSEGDFNLMKEIDGGTGRIIIMHIINEDLFNYYSAIDYPVGGMVMPVTGVDLKDIRIVSINISVDQGGSQSLRTMDLDTAVSLRNRI